MASLAYFDTSCLVKLLVAEANTKECSEGFREAPRVVTSVIAWAEIPVALARKRTNGEVTPDQVKSMLLHVEHFFKVEVSTVALPDMFARPLKEIPRLADAYPPLRSLDAIHLASAIALRERQQGAPIDFFCADKRLIDAAKAEGFTVRP